MIRQAVSSLFRVLLLTALLAVPTWCAVADAASGVATGAAVSPDAGRGVLAETDKAAVRAVAAALAATPDRLDAVLGELGFNTVAKELPGYAEWPTLRKVEAAYWSAVAAGGPAEGDRLLRDVVIIVKRDHSAAIIEEPHLAKYFSTSEPGGGSIAFKRPPAEDLARLPSEEVRRAVLAIERYADRVPGGLQGVMNSCCYSNLDRVYATLRSSSSREEALIAAIQNGSLPPHIKERLLRAIGLVMERSAAVAYEPELPHLLKQLDPSGENVRIPPTTATPPKLASSDADDLGKLREVYERALHAANPNQISNFPAFNDLWLNTNPGPAPAPVFDRQGSSNEATNAQRFAKIQASAGQPASLGAAAPKPLGTALGDLPRFKFQALRVSPAGFGGVVFGNTVTADGVGKPVRALWVPDAAANGKTSGWGHFDIVLDTHTVVMSRRMRDEDAYAAWEIVTGRPDVFAAMDIGGGEGVGLASVGRDGDPGHMVVHPALYERGLGNAAAFSDAIGFGMSAGAFCRRLEAAQIAAPVILNALRWQVAEKGYYKILDAPLRVVTENGYVTVTQPPTIAVPPALARVAFLDFQAFDENESPVTSSDFTSSVPALIAAFPEFARLNAFAETFAIMRWISASGAAIVPPLKPVTVPPLLFIKGRPDGELSATVDRDTSAGKPADIVVGVEAEEVGLACQLRAAGAPASALVPLRNLIEARKELARIEIVSAHLLQALRKEKRKDEAELIAVALEGQQRAPIAVLKRFMTPEGIVATFSPGQDADKLIALGERLRAAKMKFALDRYAVGRMSVGDAQISAPLPETDTKLFNKRLAEAKADMAKAQTALNEIQREYDKLMQSLTPPWLISASDPIASFASGRW